MAFAPNIERAPFLGALLRAWPCLSTVAAPLEEAGRAALHRAPDFVVLLLQAAILAQLVGLVRLLPGECGGLVLLAVAVDVLDFLRLAAEVAVRGGGLVHRVDQVEHLHDAVRTQVEVLADQLLDFVVGDLAGAEGGHRDRSRFGDADRVGDLHFALVGQAGGDDVLRHVTRGISGRTVDLRRILARERAAAVAGHAAVAVDDDLAAGQAAVAHRAADHEDAGRIDVHLVLRQLVEPVLRQHRLEDVLVHALDQILLLDARIVLRGQHDGVEADDLVAFIAQRDLRLRIGAQPRQLGILGLAHLRLLLDQAVRVVDRRGHEFRRFVAGVAEHQALVARALFFRLLAVDARGDVRRLLAEHVDDRAGVAVEPDVGVVVTDVVDDLARERFDVDPRGRGDFARDDRGTRFHHRFAGHARALVLRQDGVEDRVGDLVGDLVRVAFGDGFGGEEVAGAGHRCLYPLIRMKGWAGIVQGPGRNCASCASEVANWGMDSFTHLFVGGAIAAAIAPPGQRRAALLAGAALNTLPDLDVLPLLLSDDPVVRMTWHRAATHSRSEE